MEINKTTSSSAYLIIGKGRLAKHLEYYFQSLNIHCKTWNRSESLNSLNFLLNETPVVLLAVSDKSIDTLYTTHLTEYNGKVLHFSGAINHAKIDCAHPLMTFGYELYPLAVYKKIAFICNKENLLPELPNKKIVLSSEEKSFYHALCVLGGNFSSLLAHKMSFEFEKLGIPSEFSKLYIHQSIENVFSNPGKFFTGPLARGDLSTIENNLLALERDPFKQIYLAFWQTWQQLQQENKNENSRFQIL